MVNLRRSVILCALALAGVSLHGQQIAPVSGPNTTKQAEPFKEDRANWTEVVSERTIHSSTYKTGDGRVIVEHSSLAVNYYNTDGKLVPVNITPTTSLDGLFAGNQPTPVEVLWLGGIRIYKEQSPAFTFSRSTRFNGQTLIPSTPKSEGNSARCKTNISGVEKTFEFKHSAVKYNYVLNKPLQLNGDLTIEEHVDLPKGANVKHDVRLGERGTSGWKGQLVIEDENGMELGTVGGLVCYDATGAQTVGSYVVESRDETTVVRMTISKTWLQDGKRAYPITIDPLVTGPTTQYTGPNIPSCLSPNTGSDSILIQVPAQVSVTALVVSGSFYANPFSTAVMNDGLMYFRTKCGQSGNYTTSGASGAVAGTAFLTNENIRSPLTCCIPQSCNADSFWLSMHVGRTVGGVGCNTALIYHNPFGGYPFRAYIEGRTVEPFGPGWNINKTAICSDECTLTGTFYGKYGVPPYTISHPWMSNSIVTNIAPSGCSEATTIQTITLTVPNCPWTCDTITTLSVPPPLITDACGNNAAGINPKSLAVNAVPEVTALPDTMVICSGAWFSTTLTPCVPGAGINWWGNGKSGTGTIIADTLTNHGNAPVTTPYAVTAANGTCLGDTITVAVSTIPIPQPAFTYDPTPIVATKQVTFTDGSTIFGGPSTNWFWDFGDGSISGNQNPTHTYAEPGTYTVCFAVTTSEGCFDTLCVDVEVVPAQLELPNVVTPNGDPQNETLHFKYLEFLGPNRLEVYNRWGLLVYEKDNYQNDWVPKDQADGTYYYVLTILDTGVAYTSALTIISGK